MLVRQLLAYFQMGNPKADPYLQCAKGISTAATLYMTFVTATVDVRVLQRSLNSMDLASYAKPHAIQEISKRWLHRERPLPSFYHISLIELVLLHA